MPLPLLKPPPRVNIISLMLKDLFLRAFRLKRPDPGSGPGPDVIEEEADSFDPDNPFPDVVEIEFQDVLDLHSIPPRQVRAVVEGYLEEARSRNVRWVRIIHGKGIGVQREIVRSILARTPFVIHYADAPMDAGGWGATVATLEDSG